MYGDGWTEKGVPVAQAFDSFKRPGARGSQPAPALLLLLQQDE